MSDTDSPGHRALTELAGGARTIDEIASAIDSDPKKVAALLAWHKRSERCDSDGRGTWSIRPAGLAYLGLDPAALPETAAPPPTAEAEPRKARKTRKAPKAAPKKRAAPPSAAPALEALPGPCAALLQNGEILIVESGARLAARLTRAQADAVCTLMKLVAAA